MDVRAAIAELATLVETLERDGDERALLVLQLVDALHRPALEHVAAGDVDHPLVRELLTMYDLVDVDTALLAEEALDEVRPYIESHGGEIELLRVDGGDVHVRLGGSCDGCPGSTMTLTRGVEEALREHMPGFGRLVAHTPEPSRQAAPLLQIEMIDRLPRPVFADVLARGDLTSGTFSVVDADGTDVLVAEVDGEVYAVRDGCPVDGRSLAGGRLTGSIVVCPWHNCAYDVRTGRRADDPGLSGRLGVIPVAVQDGLIKVAVNVA